MPWRRDIFVKVCQEVFHKDMSHRFGLHEDFLINLDELLEREGWSIRFETGVEYETYLKARREMMITKGRVDLGAVKGSDQFIWLEIDNSHVLKIESIKKMMQCKGLVIGITAGRYHAKHSKRIRTMIRKLGKWECSDFWLIEIKPQRIRCFIRDGKEVYEEHRLREGRRLVMITKWVLKQ